MKLNVENIVSKTTHAVGSVAALATSAAIICLSAAFIKTSLEIIFGKKKPVEEKKSTPKKKSTKTQKEN